MPTSRHGTNSSTSCRSLLHRSHGDLDNQPTKHRMTRIRSLNDTSIRFLESNRQVQLRRAGGSGQCFLYSQRFFMLPHRAVYPKLQGDLHVLRPKQEIEHAKKMVLQRICDQRLAVVQMRSAAATAASVPAAARNDVLRPRMGNPCQRGPHP